MIINFFFKSFFLDENSKFKQLCNIKTESDKEFFLNIF